MSGAVPPEGTVVDAAEKLIALGDGGPVPAGAGTIAHRRFEEIARARPDLVAVVAYDETLTYGELNARADLLCSRLRAAGVAREQVVGICLPRRLDVLVAVLAVMKSGGAYLPLALVQPLERRRFMLRDAEAKAVVTVTGWEDELNEDGALAGLHPGSEG